MGWIVSVPSNLLSTHLHPGLCPKNCPLQTGYIHFLFSWFLLSSSNRRHQQEIKGCKRETGIPIPFSSYLSNHKSAFAVFLDCNNNTRCHNSCQETSLLSKAFPLSSANFSPCIWPSYPRVLTPYHCELVDMHTINLCVKSHFIKLYSIILFKYDICQP